MRKYFSSVDVLQEIVSSIESNVCFEVPGQRKLAHCLKIKLLFSNNK